MSATAIRSDWVGQVIDGRFTLLKWLGGSSRSGVFLTELPGPQGLKGAIKLTFAESEEDIEQHLAGWAATRPLSHPNLLRLLQTGRCEMEDGILLYSVSEYADEVLSELLPERALTPDECKEMLVPIMDTLAYLHSKGLVHGHLSPANLLVVDDKLKLSGDCLQAVNEAGRPVSELTIYDAPERAGGVITPEGDLWSLGATLVEALTQKPPEWDKAMEEDPVVPAEIPQPLAGIARGCLRADPLGRCNLGNVRTWLETKGPTPTRIAARVQAPADEFEEKAPSKFPVMTLVAAVVVIAAVVAVFAMRSHKTGDTAPVAAVSSDAPRQTDSTVTATQAAPQEKAAPAAAEPRAQDQTSPAVAATPAADPTPAATKPAAVPDPVTASAPAPAPAAVKSATPVGAVADAVVVDQVKPDVLPKALASIHGAFNVRIKVTVDAAGNVSDASFESAGPSQYFANAAMKAVRQWKFKPGQAGSLVEQFRFSQDGAEISTVAAE